jgi:hypothetical protein
MDVFSWRAGLPGDGLSGFYAAIAAGGGGLAAWLFTCVRRS